MTNEVFQGGNKYQLSGEQSVANYIWDTASMSWVADTGTGGSGGGGSGGGGTVANVTLVQIADLHLVGDVIANGNTYGNITATLSNTSVTSGVYGSSVNIPQITVDSAGRITNASNVSISIPPSYTNSNVATYLASGTDATITAIQSNVGNLQVDVGLVNGNVSSLSSNVGNLWANVSSLSGNVSSLSSNVGNLWANVGSLSGNVSSLSSNVGNLWANVGSLSGNVTTLFSNAATQQITIDSLSGNVGNLWANASTQQTSINSISSNVTTLFSNANSQQSEIDSLSTNISLLSSSVQPPFLINVGDTYKVNGNSQVLFKEPITINGNLVVEGHLIDMSLIAPLIVAATSANAAPLIFTGLGAPANALAIGPGAVAAANSVSIGENAGSGGGGPGPGVTSIGALAGSQNYVTYATNIGFNTQVSQNNGVAIGANATATTGVSIGADTVSGGYIYGSGVAIGSNVSTFSGIAIGSNMSASGGIGIGSNVNIKGGGIGIGLNAYTRGLGDFAMGRNSKAGSNLFSESVAIGNQAQDTGSTNICIGSSTHTSGSWSLALGHNSRSSNNHNAAIGFYLNATIPGCLIYGGNFYNNTWTIQGSLAAYTTDATLTNMVVDMNNDFMILDDNTNYMLTAKVMGSDNTDYYSASIEFMIMRSAGAGTTTIIGTPTKTVLVQTGGAATWDLTITADTTYGCPYFGITGEVGKNIRWGGSVFGTVLLRI